MTSARIFYDGMPSEELHWCLERQTPGMRDRQYRGVRFVCNDHYDFAIFLNRAVPVLTPAERNICFLMEPPEKMRPPPDPAIGTIFSFNPDDRETFGDRWVHRHMFSFLHAEVLTEDQPLPSRKPRPMSMVISGKTDTHFQRKRFALAEALLRTDLPIDFFGRDFAIPSRDPRVKGPLPRLDKTAALREYSLSLAFENSPQEGYLTEKFLDCVVNHCIPVTNNVTAASHFPPNSFVCLDFSEPIETLVEQVASLVRHPPPLDDAAVLKAKCQILHGDWSLAEAIVSFISTRPNIPGSTDRKSPASGVSAYRSAIMLSPHKDALPKLTSESPGSNSDVRTPIVSVLFLSCRRMHYLKQTVAAIREHLDTIESALPVTWLCFDNGSSATDRQELLRMGFDLLSVSDRNLGIGPAMNRLVSQVRSPYILNLQDDWVLQNPRGLRFISECIRIMNADPRIAHVKLDDCHFLNFHDAAVYDGPFRAKDGSVQFYCQNPRMLWGGFSFPPALTRTDALYALGPFREDRPFQRGWAESEFTQRYASAYLAAKSPEMVLFHHIGDQPTSGWGSEQGTAPLPGRVPDSPPPEHGRSICFVIPYRRDSEERAQNIRAVQAHLERCIGRRGWRAEVRIESPPEKVQSFHKTRLVNDAFRRSGCDVLALIDADVLIPDGQLAAALDLIAAGVDIVYPHSGAFFDVPRTDLLLIGEDPELGQLSLASERYRNLHASSVGGAVLIRGPAFWAAGGMNEHFTCWGREDVELYHRLTALGYSCNRVPGPLFHLSHPRPADNHFYSTHGHASGEEFNRIKAMTPAQLLDEVGAWSWAHA